VDLGWQPEDVVSVTLSPPMPRELRRPWFRYVEWSDRLTRRLEAAPGVARAAITTQVPLAPQAYPATIARGRGKASADPARWPAFRHHVTDGYFDTMRLEVVEGRAFDRTDRFTEPQVNGIERLERGAVIVSESTARALWPGQPAAGQALWFADGDSTVSWREVVGVVADIHFQSVGETPGLHLFVPWTQTATGNPKLVVRTRGDAAAAIPLIRRIIEDVEPGTRITGVAPLEALFATATAQPRFTTQLVAAFGSLALLLAAVGIYGTLSYLVSARRREIGIRLALGARPAAIMSTVLRRGVVPALGGALVGLAAATAIARVFRALLFHIEPADPLSIAAAAAVLALVVSTAALVPARRAARVDPTVALRSE
jgi:predicted permease